MNIKFCEKQFNLSDGCQTLSLGTLQSYTDDDKSFLRYDYNEGKIEITNHGERLYLDPDHAKKFSSGGIIGGGIEVERGGTITRYLEFPNCYIYCFSQNIQPTIENAKKIDPNYDSYYAISNINQFIKATLSLLHQQININDLNINQDVSFDYLRKVNIQVACQQVIYGDKTKHVHQGNIDKNISIIENSIEWVFLKDEKYNSLSEYRIVFIIMDEFGNQISVKKRNKILKLLPDMGISSITNHST